jgi:hypothetical protein
MWRGGGGQGHKSGGVEVGMLGWWVWKVRHNGVRHLEHLHTGTTAAAQQQDAWMLGWLLWGTILSIWGGYKAAGQCMIKEGQGHQVRGGVGWVWCGGWL